MSKSDEKVIIEALKEGAIIEVVSGDGLFNDYYYYRFKNADSEVLEVLCSENQISLKDFDEYTLAKMSSSAHKTLKDFFEAWQDTDMMNILEYTKQDNIPNLTSITDILIKCIEIDIANMGENGQKTIQDVLNFYKGISLMDLNKIYIEYYGNGTNE